MESEETGAEGEPTSDDPHPTRGEVAALSDAQRALIGLVLVAVAILVVVAVASVNRVEAEPEPCWIDRLECCEDLDPGFAHRDDRGFFDAEERFADEPFGE